jgi:hypothetical protein
VKIVGEGTVWKLRIMVANHNEAQFIICGFRVLGQEV